ncbi:MAG: DUF4038 domain-containing protein [Candidatus Latescibacteria bacterium]|nr:DUF4038 domain-containing protein [Candidatus Latescibacterota bacterium]
MSVFLHTQNSNAAVQVGIWQRFEASFISSKAYENSLYDVKKFETIFTSPTGRVKKINGFWDGGQVWKIRFCPDERGTWTYETECSDEKNTGLHGINGTVECVSNNSKLDIYTKGGIIRPEGTYHLTHADGTPFFWAACTAWNGALKSTEKEWDTYLEHRASHGYNVIQFTTTQWRGCAANSLGQVAFEGSERIRINPEFFQHLDGKINRINDYGLVAAPVLLWALPFGEGRELSPGYYLPDKEAILLAKYLVARYGGHHIVWILGGDGRYVEEFEQRWKNIGRGVFGDKEHPGLVTLHPHGLSWIGDAYIGEDWLDIIAYQSSHSAAKGTVEWINTGPPSQQWDILPARPIINMEPLYENIDPKLTDNDVRHACYWSVFATPVAGITYGANGIWSWLREGETLLNHRHFPEIRTWDKSLDFPGTIQVGYLAGFMRKYEWWRFRPAPELLVNQPGKENYQNFISVLKTDTNDIIMAYVPVRSKVSLFNTLENRYTGQWFNPVTNTFSAASIDHKNGLIETLSPADGDYVLVLEKQ